MTLHLNVTPLGMLTHVRPLLLVVGLPLCGFIILAARKSRHVAWMLGSVAVTLLATATSLWFMVDPHLQERWRLRQMRRRQDVGHCRHCGHELVDDVQTCPDCGRKL